jgi:hypothetical protein
VRVSRKGGGLQNLTFTFQQTDDFLTKLDQMVAPYLSIQERLLLVLAHDTKTRLTPQSQSTPTESSVEANARMMRVDKLDYVMPKQSLRTKSRATLSGALTTERD